jgi:hypothetical protein
MKKAVVVLLSLATFHVSPSFAVAIYKDQVNPTGVPDVYQGNTCFCEAAAWADGVWWYNQYRPELVNTQVNNWFQTSQTLFNDLKTKIYDQKRGAQGVLLYINSKRPGDFSPAKDPNNRGQREIESTWSIQHFNWKQTRKKDPGSDIEAEARTSLGNQHKFSVLGTFLHENGKDSTDWLVPLKDGSQGLLGHSLAYAGRDPRPDNSSSHLFLAHGWGPSHEAGDNPVSVDYYDRYAITVAQPGVAGYHANHLQITDQNFFGSAGGLAPNANIDYAGVTTMGTLRDDHKGTSKNKRFAVFLRT